MASIAPLAIGAFLVGVGGFAGFTASAQEPGVQTIAAGEGVAMLIGRGGNLGVLHGPDGVLVVDSQFDDMAPALLAAIAELRAGAPIEWLVNTHHHGDHVGGNVRLGAGATRMAHAKVRERMPAEPAAALPFLTWETGVTLHLNGQRVEMRHVGPAHTDGDTIVIFHDAGVIHTGDVFFHGMFPYVDLDGGGSVAGALEALRGIRAALQPGWKVIPGHGPLADAAGIDAAIAMIEATLGVVKERAESGLSRAEIVSAGLPEEWAGWSWRFITTERWLETLARECGVR